MLPLDYNLFLEIAKYLPPNDLANLRLASRQFHRFFQSNDFWVDLIRFRVGLTSVRSTSTDYHILYYLTDFPENFPEKDALKTVELGAWLDQQTRRFWLYQPNFLARDKTSSIITLARTIEGAFLKIRWLQDTSNLDLISYANKNYPAWREEFSHSLKDIGETYQVYLYQPSKNYLDDSDINLLIKFLYLAERTSDTPTKYFYITLDVWKEPLDNFKHQLASFLKNKFFRARTSQGAILEANRVIQENFPSMSFIRMLRNSCKTVESTRREIEMINHRGNNWFIHQVKYILPDGKKIDIFSTIIIIESRDQLIVF